MLLRRTSERRSDSYDVFPSMNSSPRVILQMKREREKDRAAGRLCPDPSLGTAGFNNAVIIQRVRKAAEDITKENTGENVFHLL